MNALRMGRAEVRRQRAQSISRCAVFWKLQQRRPAQPAARHARRTSAPPEDSEATFVIESASAQGSTFAFVLPPQVLEAARALLDIHSREWEYFHHEKTGGA